MKKKFYLFTIILIATAFVNASTVQAKNLYRDHDYFSGSQPNGSATDCNTNTGHNYSPADGGKTTNNAPAGPSTNLPINNGVIFLFIAGMVIGVVTLNKLKTLTPAVKTVRA